MPLGAEAGGVEDGVVDGNEDLAFQRLMGTSVPVIKGDDVSGAGVLEESFVDSGHFGLIHEMDGEVKLVLRKERAKQMEGDPAEAGKIDFSGFLAAADLQVFHFRAVRCSS
jgi:CRISPR/Cas system CMR subunit Cmr4 (Cas7 group RAMP superfamily)